MQQKSFFQFQVTTGFYYSEHCGATLTLRTYFKSSNQAWLTLTLENMA
jgi:hypothetical protein